MTEECTLEFEPGGPVRLAGPMTFDSCAALYEAMQRHAGNGERPGHIDLWGVTTADSAGLALLLEWQAENRTAGKELVISGAPDSLVRLAQLNGADDLLNLSGRDAP